MDYNEYVISAYACEYALHRAHKVRGFGGSNNDNNDFHIMQYNYQSALKISDCIKSTYRYQFSAFSL